MFITVPQVPKALVFTMFPYQTIAFFLFKSHGFRAFLWFINVKNSGNVLQPVTFDLYTHYPYATHSAMRVIN